MRGAFRHDFFSSLPLLLLESPLLFSVTLALWASPAAPAAALALAGNGTHVAISRKHATSKMRCTATIDATHARMRWCTCCRGSGCVFGALAVRAQDRLNVAVGLPANTRHKHNAARSFADQLKLKHSHARSTTASMHHKLTGFNHTDRGARMQPATTHAPEAVVLDRFVHLANRHKRNTTGKRCRQACTNAHQSHAQIA
jgi:hypothetical protein